jgi:hypothetical protein
MPVGVRAALGHTAVGLACAAVVASGASGAVRVTGETAAPRQGRRTQLGCGDTQLGPEERWRPASTLLSPPCSLGCS